MDASMTSMEDEHVLHHQQLHQQLQHQSQHVVSARHIEMEGAMNDEDSAAGGGGDDADDASVVIPDFKPLNTRQLNHDEAQYQRVMVPPHRFTPLKTQWMELYDPIVTHMKLQIRFNPKRRCIELRTSEQTEHPNAMQKSVDFLHAFLLGFEVRDAIALLRLDDLYIDSFEVKDVKTLSGDHLSRAIGRIAGHQGKTRFTIENSTKTRIVLADSHVHILGTYQNIQAAKRAIVRLIMGSPPGKVYTQMRAVATRMNQSMQ